MPLTLRSQGLFFGLLWTLGVRIFFRISRSRLWRGFRRCVSGLKRLTVSDPPRQKVGHALKLFLQILDPLLQDNVSLIGYVLFHLFKSLGKHEPVHASRLLFTFCTTWINSLALSNSSCFRLSFSSRALYLFSSSLYLLCSTQFISHLCHRPSVRSGYPYDPNP